MKNCVIASTSTLFGGSYLDYLLNALSELYKDTDEILFIPYARPSGISHDEYTAKASEAFQQIDKQVVGIHTFSDPLDALKKTTGVFTGGGNTFLLVSQLYKHAMMQPLRMAILNGLPYLGTSAGSNICGLTMQTTNDMPIVYPPSFKTLGIVPFNINPHYLDPISNSEHMGETRETRINEFHTQNTVPVVGLREGSWLRATNHEIILKGDLSARVFEQNKSAIELGPGTNFARLFV
ncbi:dipeptidase PepE [Candidatus Ulvibacter alkanivorans]|uniref:dipeptidase PepE n=1 Tax=Candidatus Ulvibacter alkanivorans TaxID=2267620 RepID=UPI000DF262D3|nr:dipeptidase PepE [Candidatus Ulvibacter alkanivorans]